MNDALIRLLLILIAATTAVTDRHEPSRSRCRPLITGGTGPPTIPAGDQTAPCRVREHRSCR